MNCLGIGIGGMEPDTWQHTMAQTACRRTCPRKDIHPAGRQVSHMIARTRPDRQKAVVVIGNGMVGHRFIERLVGFDEAKKYSIVTFCEETRAAYNRVNLTKFFEYRAAEPLMIANLDWYREHDVALFLATVQARSTAAGASFDRKRVAKFPTTALSWLPARRHSFRQ